MGLIKKATGARRPYVYHLAILGGAVLVLLIGGLIRGGNSGERPEDATETSALETLRMEVSGVQNALRRNELEAIRITVSEATRTVAPSVVAITPRLETVEAPRRIEVYDLPGGIPINPVPFEPDRTASGLLLDAAGYILTSARVADYDFPVQAVLSAARLPADLIATDQIHNLALLKLRSIPGAVTAVNPGIVSDLSAGEWLVAQSRSSSGASVVSMHFLESVLPTADGTPVGILSETGESSLMDGTTLIDAYGRIGGLYLRSPEGSGYVLPIQKSYEIAQSLKAAALGPKRGWAGLRLQELNGDLKEYFGVENGVLVSSLFPDGPAEESGLRVLDLIQRINDEEVYSPRRVLEIVAQNPPGARLTVSIRRSGETKTLEVLLSGEPVNSTASPPPSDGLALELGPSTDDAPGVVILSAVPFSVANSAGIKTGDVIRSVEGTPIRTVNQFWTAQRRIAPDKLQLWRVARAGNEFFVIVRESVSQP